MKLATFNINGIKARIDALPQCVSADNPRRDPPISAHDYLTERLIEIGLIKKG